MSSSVFFMLSPDDNPESLMWGGGGQETARSGATLSPRFKLT